MVERWSWYSYNVLLCKIKPVFSRRLIVLYIRVACTALHRGSEFAQTSECIHCCWCGSFNTYTLGNSEGMPISSYWHNLAVSSILITIASELQVLCFATLLSLCIQISHWCCCRELYKIRRILIFISIMCSWEMFELGIFPFSFCCCTLTFTWLSAHQLNFHRDLNLRLK